MSEAGPQLLPEHWRDCRWLCPPGSGSAEVAYCHSTAEQNPQGPAKAVDRERATHPLRSP